MTHEEMVEEFRSAAERGEMANATAKRLGLGFGAASYLRRLAGIIGHSRNGRDTLTVSRGGLTAGGKRVPTIRLTRHVRHLDCQIGDKINIERIADDRGPALVLRKATPAPVGETLTEAPQE